MDGYTIGASTMLTQAELKEFILYDPVKGVFYWQQGQRAGQRCCFTTAPPVKIRKNTPESCPTLHKPPTNAPRGYSLITENRFIAIQSGAEDIQTGMKRVKKENVYTIVRPLTYQLYYKNKDGRVIPYYLIRNPKQYPRIKLKGKSYPAHQLAVLFMGAGGNYDYKITSNGFYNAYRKNDQLEPEGLHYYNPETNKKLPMYFKDGNNTNLKWDNIAPIHRPLTNILEIPVVKTKDRKPAVYSTRVYQPDKCIAPYGERFIITIAERVIYADTYKQAITAYNDLIDSLNGKVVKNKDGSVEVTLKKHCKRFKK